MIWGISCLQFCKKSADQKEGNTCCEVPIDPSNRLEVEKNYAIGIFPKGTSNSRSN